MTNQKIQSFMNIYSKLMSKKKKLFNRFSSKKMKMMILIQKMKNLNNQSYLK